MADFARCKSCQASIMWARSSSTGRLMPLDAEPSMDGNIAIGGNGEAVVLAGDKLANHKGLRHKSHFATCPNAKGHRKSTNAE